MARLNIGEKAMSYATLMVHLQLGQPNKALLKITADLAERCKAGVIGIAVCQPMRIIYNDGYVPGDIFEQDRKEIDEQTKAAEAEFRVALGGRIGTIEWRSAVTYQPLSTYLANEACCTDLVITGVDRNTSLFDTSRHVDIGDLVMQAGRPCLIVPAATADLALRHAVIGWKDTGETRRAIRDALPLLKAAARVSVVEIADKEAFAASRVRLQGVVGWLRRHGVEATAITSPSTGADAAQLNTIVAEQGGDLLVAGAYGHSRVHEWALGGVTRDLLLRADHCAMVSH
jgi:nucleotide-binding universal stress UspA family protein